MSLHPLAGQPAPFESLANIPRLVSAYYSLHPDPNEVSQKVAFGTSGHRGTSTNASFNDDHVAAITQAIIEHRRAEGITGPLFMGMDTHALSEPALYTAIEVFAGNGVEIHIHQDHRYTPTPVISHAILTWNELHSKAQADGVVISPSHNPPEDGGFKYNPPNGGPADTSTTKWIQNRANEIIANKLRNVKRIPLQRAMESPTTIQIDLQTPYLQDLGKVINMQAIRDSGIRIGVDPLGGSGVAYWEPMAEMYGLNLTVVNKRVDPTFSFMTLDKDGKIRMDCSSPYAMASLVALKDDFEIAFGNDVDYDRHGIVCPGSGLMNPNHYLAVAIWYLFQNRPGWSEQAAVGKTLVSSSMIDKVVKKIGKRLCEVPVGFKWFVPGLLSGDIGFGGEESAGASFLRLDGKTWTTDKDGFIMDLLAAEILAITGKNPAQHYQVLEAELGSSWYARLDAPANAQQKAVLSSLSPDLVKAESMAGDPILAKLTNATCNNAPIGGLKVVTENGWFAARPSGTEDIYKIYAESLKSEEHLTQIQAEARKIVDEAMQNG
ncbi:MAG: phosphoglucomutase (alpha-D-glucose-1,6-bisphosphate-dependent) [Anaerolineaceae bacterium]|nr:phosphoglucomutase (alpha-D-glucose-1,6-bisphosphate-dependent) [Anaerolineaceae bacterium]